MNITIVGLGYVGLPLACLCARKGHKTIGLDINEAIVDAVNRGESHIKDPELEKQVEEVKGMLKASIDPETISDADVVVLCIPTPVDGKQMPDLTPVIKACETVSRHLKQGQLIIIESTIYPGTVEEVVAPTLEQSGMKAGTDFFVAHCPERIDPGNKKWNVNNLARVCGGINKESTDRCTAFYNEILDAEITPLNSVKAAEAVKIMENTFRDVNIAFMNELAKSFERAGIDITEVIKGAATKPFAFLPHHPGCGVGGHCIGVDPYYLIERAKSYGFDHQFLALARKINKSMPKYTVGMLTQALNNLHMSVRGTRIGILGLAYKADVDDIRESPALEVIKILKARGATIVSYDPYLPDKSTVSTLYECLKMSDVIVLCTNHKEFMQMDYQSAAEEGIKVIIDGRNCLDKEAVERAGIVYKGIGR